jgi:hypothetical protein
MKSRDSHKNEQRRKKAPFFKTFIFLFCASCTVFKNFYGAKTTFLGLKIISNKSLNNHGQKLKPENGKNAKVSERRL